MWILEILIGLIKIIGIGLLLILSIVLLLLLLILFGAIRYRVEGSVKSRESAGLLLTETLNADVTVSWLNPLFRLLVSVKGKKLSYRFHLFGICILDSEAPKKPDRRKKEKSDKSDVFDTEPQDDTKTARFTEPPVEETGAEPAQSTEEPSVTEAAEEPVVQERTDIKTEPLKQHEKREQETPKKQKKAAARERVSEKKKKVDLGLAQETVHGTLEKKRLITEFLQDEANRKTIAGSFRTITKVILHILPVGVQGTVVYGSGDPAVTGKVFAVLGMFYAKYGRCFTLQPDFQEKRLEADVTFWGRIRPGVMMWYLLSFVLKRETRAFMKRGIQLVRKCRE